MSTRKNLRPTKYPREKVWDLGNTHEKKIGTHEKKFEVHEIPTRNYFGLTKYPREKFSDPQRHDGTVAFDPRDPRNLAHSGQIKY